jgi:hypothetical protein
MPTLFVAMSNSYRDDYRGDGPEMGNFPESCPCGLGTHWNSSGDSYAPPQFMHQSVNLLFR